MFVWLRICCVVCRKDIGLEKFFKSSLLSSVKRKNLRAMVLQVTPPALDGLQHTCVWH